jgi:D-amino peptidase
MPAKPRIALLITDLEGVAGVDDAVDLIAGHPGFARAQGLLRGEIAAAVEGLLAAGFAQVRVSDSHRPGIGATLRPEDLPAGAVLAPAGDPYGAARFKGVAAVACLGMHAPAGTLGFAAHTLDVHCALEVRRSPLGELDLIAWLASERGIPLVFASGDDVLEGLAPRRLCFVRTKRAVSSAAALSVPPEQAREALRQAAQAEPIWLRPPAPAPLQLCFKSRWQADRAQRAGAMRRGECRVEVASAASARALYARARRLLRQAAEPLPQAVRTFSPESLREDALALLARGFERARPPGMAHRARGALVAFFRLTEGPASWQRVNRVLVLHMLEGHAPRFFGGAGLRSALRRAQSHLDSIPRVFEPGLAPLEAMVRVDAAWLAHERGLEGPGPDTASLSRYLRALALDGQDIFAWLLGEMAHQAGLCERPPIEGRPLRERARREDLFWLTHRFLLRTRFLRRALPARGCEAEIEELLLAAPFVLAGGQGDLAAQVAFCLQRAWEGTSAEHRALLRFLADQQREDGSVPDPSASAEGVEAERLLAHSTAGALIAFAGARERGGARAKATRARS